MLPECIFDWNNTRTCKEAREFGTRLGGMRRLWSLTDVSLLTPASVADHMMPCQFPLKECLISENKFIRLKRNSSEQFVTPENAVATEKDNSDRGKRLVLSLERQDIHRGAHSFLLLSGQRGSFLGDTRPRHEVSHSTPPSPEGKNEWSYGSTPYMPSWCGKGKLLVMKVCAKCRLCICDNVHWRLMWHQSTFQHRILYRWPGIILK
jgi:hypothetical protein